MTQSDLENKDEWVSVEGPFTAKDLRALREHRQIKRLSLTKQALVTAKIASGFSAVQSVRSLWLWCSVTRTAMRHVISIPDLETLDILEICYPGSLANFAEANTLKVFRCNNCMVEADLVEISTSRTLQELGAQSATITQRALDGLLQMSTLEHLDLEGTEFDDEMAATVAGSKTLKKLDVGASRLTSKGLKKLCEMSQLNSLDIWAVDIIETDLDFLSMLPKLEYLSIGGLDDQTILTSKGVLPRLEEITSLKGVWLDGIRLTDNERTVLEQRYEYVRN